MFMRALPSLLWLAALTAAGEELGFDFSRFPVGEAPPGFSSLVAGEGAPGEWRVIMDEVPSLLPPLAPGLERTYKKAVLAQLAKVPLEEHFPILIYEGETLSDFRITTRFKLVSGERERMAGIAFRFQNTNNYYYIRASGLGNTFNFFKVVNGIRSAPIIHDVEIASGQWHEMTIECKGTKIQAWLNGKEALPQMDDRSLIGGRVGFWTMADSVAYFTDTHITYEPPVPLVATLVEQTMEQYDRLLGLAISVIPEGGGEPVIIASSDPKEVDTKAWKEEAGVITSGQVYHLKRRGRMTVSLPLRDRNGIPVAAVRVVMKSFPGQTEKNALTRALTVVKSMEPRVLSGKDLTR